MAGVVCLVCRSCGDSAGSVWHIELSSMLLNLANGLPCVWKPLEMSSAECLVGVYLYIHLVGVNRPMCM